MSTNLLQIGIHIRDRQICNEIEQLFCAHWSNTFLAEKNCNVVAIHSQKLQSVRVIVLD
jgi:hypothetical protein